MTPEQKEQHRKTIGASDVAAIFGWDSFRGPLAVYMEKKGLYDQQENEFMTMGTQMEPVIVGQYAKSTGRKVRRNNITYTHPKWDWATATPDAFPVPKEELGIECKNRIIFLADRYGDTYFPNYDLDKLPPADEIQPSEMCQSQWCMEITGLKEWHLAVYFGGLDFRIYRVVYDARLVALLLEGAHEFWRNHVLAEEPPEIDGTNWSNEYLKETYPETTLGPAMPSEEDMMLYFEYLTHKKRKDEVEKQEKALRNQLLERIGEHDGMQDLFSYKSQRGRVSYKEAIFKCKGVTQEFLEQFRGDGFRKFNAFKK